ncbi:MAG TPA: bifunctional lysylphosphatidylglycerol flippase/synthetase MprF, partial [Tahibacter sp.]|uniref:bifunctional lysylphosphatidylglycerol flippase/synthetase MprF n=1 Tax=Tahibacter sp. TaxID=2056211 RepID=UPI002CEAC3E7
QALALPLGLSMLVAASFVAGPLPLAPGTAARWLAIAVLVAAGLYLPLYLALTGQRRLMRWLPPQQPLPSLRLRAELSLISLADWLLAAATLYVCLRISGAAVAPMPLLLAFAGASVLGLVSLVPGGLGVFDGLLLLALGQAGYDQAAVVSGLFLFRLSYYLLPLFVGLYLGSGLLVDRLPQLARLRERLAGHPLYGLLQLPASLLADLGIRLIAVFTFAAGTLLLASAAIPALHERLHAAGAYLSLLTIESSYWLSVLTGVLLLGLARGIDGRLRVAYRLTQFVLAASALLALAKGLHVGEALFLLGVALLLRSRKSAFSQRAMHLNSFTAAGWFAGLLVAVVVFFAIGVAAVLGDDSFDLFYVGFGEHSSRLARGLGAAALGVAVYLIWQSFAVRRPAPLLPHRAELDEARELYRRHGGGEFGHLSFMGDKSLFWAGDRQAVVAYGTIRDRLVALGSPCGSEAAVSRAILDFRRFADSQDRVPVFYEVLEPELSRYHDHGFDLFKLGELATIRLADFSLSGKRWEDLRQAVNRSAKETLRFELREPPFDTALIADVQQVSDTWLADKGSNEKGFSLGRFDAAYLDWGPLALVYHEQRLVAFANVLPPYGRNGTASVDLMRHLPDAPRSSMDFLFARVMQWAQERQYERFSLGMAPLSNVGANPYARINERLAALAFRYGNSRYNYQGIRRYKEKFRPDWTGSYLAYPRGVWVPGLLVDVAALVAGGYRRLLKG